MWQRVLCEGHDGRSLVCGNACCVKDTMEEALPVVIEDGADAMRHSQHGAASELSSDGRLQ